MNVWEILLCLMGGVGAILLVCLGILWLEKNVASDNFDERQQIARGKAYRAAYYVGFVWILISLFYLTFGGDTYGMMVILFLGFEAQALTFHVYCLLTHAALPMSQRPMTSILSYGLMALIYCGNTVMGVSVDARYPDKPQAYTVMYLSMAVWAGTLCILHLIQYLRDKKE